MDSESPHRIPEENKKREEIHGTLREIGPYLTLGFQLAAAIIVFYFIGNWIDKHYGIAPMGTLIGTAVGMIGGFIKFFKSVASLIADEDRIQKSQKREN
jgi:F0F1-type ATP synthase assembly protein I